MDSTKDASLGALRERLVVGSVCLDEILGVEAWDGTKMPVEFRRRSMGGGAANVAVVQRRLSPDAPLTLLANIGQDEPGRFLRRRLRQERIAAPLPPVRGAASCRSTVIVPRKGRSKILTEANVRERPLPRDAIARLLQSAAVCCLVAPGGNEQLASLAAMAHAAGVPLFIGLSARLTKNMRLPELAEALAPGAALVMCNESEAQQLTACHGAEAALEAMRPLATRVVISRGEEGLLALANGNRYVQPAWRDPQKAFVDDTGCGDAALGGIVDALVRGLPMRAAMAVGARMAFAAGTAWGATDGLIDHREIARFLRPRQLRGEFLHATSENADVLLS